MKIVISDKSSGKSYQVEVPKENEGLLIGLKISDTFDGGSFGVEGYTLKVTGGSDNAGFPMRYDVEGPRRIKVLLTNSVGFNSNTKGDRQQKRVRGNIVSDEIAQVNCSVEKSGSKTLDELFSKKEDKKEEKK